MFYQLHEGKRIKSGALLAVAADSRNDAIATGAIIISTVIEYLTDWKIDGFMGLGVSLFILYNGVSLAKKTVSPLLGESASPELQKEIVSRIKSHPAVIDCHDLMVHDYGPGRTYASIHVEMDGEMNSIVSHEWIDEMERDCQERFGVHLTVHYDPVLVNDPQTERLRRLVIAVLKAKDERLEIHDFRVLTKEEGCELAFDILLPEDLVGQKAELEEELGEKLRVFETNRYVFRINFDM
jgi:divalent metal cation (Fe/Co/Zn/Cd) transporter